MYVAPWWQKDGSRYAAPRDWRKPPRHPTPSEKFQRDEYEACMGRPAPERQDWSGQFDYSRRSKYGRELLAQMTA